MATRETLHENVGNKEKCPKPSKKCKQTYCLLCRKYHLKSEAHEHMHGMLHHRELERVLGKDIDHHCQACSTRCMGLNGYAKHISTAQHKAQLTMLVSKNIKPVSLLKTLDHDAINRIQERNKTLRNQEKKARKKKKKKEKQTEGQKQAETQQKKSVAPSKKVKLKKSQQVKLRIWRRVQEPQQEGSNFAVFQNKENSLRRSLHCADSTLQNQSRRFVYWPEPPAGGTWHHPHVQGQFTQSSQHLSYDSNFSVSRQFSRASVGSSQTDGHLTKPHESQWDVTEMTEPMSAVSKSSYHNPATYGDFTSDCLPQSGAIIFDHGEGESSGSSQPRQEGSAQPASAKKSDNAAPIEDVDVGAMLKHIRRVLGVREPCRADREARRQNATQQAGTEVEQRAGVSLRNHATSAPSRTVPSPQVNTPASAASAAVCSSTVPKPNPGALSKTQEAPQYCEMSSVAANGQSGSREGESQVAADSWASLKQPTVEATSFEPKCNNTTKVRIAHKAAENQGVREARLKPTLNKLLSLSGARSKLSWSQICDNMKKKQLKGLPRFGIEFVNRPTIQESSTQPKDIDLPLSEGFHWESIPGSPSLLRMTLPPPPPQQTTAADCRTETPPDTQTQKTLEQPDAAQTSCRSQMVAGFSVKVEPHLKNDNGDSTDNSVTSKRKDKMLTDDGISDLEPRRKKKTMNSNKDHSSMDQLLVVSLREEELSHSLQDLDQSLFQARNALQAAYAEVQRLMLLRQQFTAEVNGLRAKRIEILQEMQEGYTGASNLAEKPSTSSALVATTVQPPSLSTSGAFPTSSSQQTPATTSASSTPQPQPTPPTLSAKQEICQLPTAGQTSYFANTVSCNTDAPQVSMKQPVPLFPPNLLPSLLLQPPHLTTPATTAASAKQPTAESSASVNPPPPESSARQQEQEKQKGMKDCVKTAADPAESVCDEVAAGNHSKGQVKLREPATDKSVRERHESAAVANDEGNQSDDSVEVIDSSNSVVIYIESDHEESPETDSNVPVQPERPQSTESTRTLQQIDTDRKIQPFSMTANEATSPAEPAEDQEPSEGAFEGHTGPVLGLQVHDGLLYTCSGDNTARAYSLVNRECQAVFEGHTNKINCLLVSSLPNMPTRLYTGSSDQTVRCYNTKSKKCLEQISLPDRVLCLHIAWHILYVGLASGSVASFDLKTLKQLDVFECHGPRGVSCLGTAQEGARRLLLVGSYDSTISVRDAKSGLLLRSLEGHSKTVLCLKVVNDLVFSGSSDTSVHAHNIHTGDLIRIYKGHGHAVTAIVILGKVMVTACLDELVRVYELQSHDRLQVYGGHSGMVMCMAVHKSVIYTGCYDGSVQAVKLNLMQNYRCWWQNCSLIFGMSDHLVQHLVRDHSNPNMQMLKCRWRGCDSFFATRQSVKEELPEHMQGHVENDSKVQP
ncbi:zinc finger protein 106 isoform X1 [Amphiprion ocellaris]|uniref:C2H2-type domain-containing protein n=2 Tax=Amphiprion ocellaris TaxID=80972 RepID=A0A3Q1CL36_AMPOC|nr:zinc finger protein 106 isoform X1 [Amphiprion ocellaris]